MTNLSDLLPYRKGSSYKKSILGLFLVLTVLFAQHATAAKPKTAKATTTAAPTTAPAAAPAAAAATTGDAASGEKLFKANCTSCHKIDSKLVGPPLKDIDKKESDEWLHKWIKNNAALRATGDKDALAIFQEYGNTSMTLFTSFSDQDISDILAYIKQQSAVPTGGGGNATGTQAPTPDPYIPILLWLLVIILGGAALVLNRNINALGKMVREKTGEPIVDRVPIYKNKTFIALATIVIVIFIGYTTVDNAIRAGHEQNYQPDQPIKFPHSLHAGINGINCLYCHAGAEKGRTAMIPSPNICMNCHKGISTGPTTGTAEIAKIYYAVGWDPAKGAYTGETHPIHWVKIHNLPAHVYFNHSQHVVVGKLACQTCHGPIQDMDQVYQYSTLSMGWCINCHRTTPVQFTTNKYYTSMFPKLNDELKSGKISQVTEADMGGTECQKCHY